MCVVSAVYDAAMQIPIQHWTQPLFQDFTSLVRRIQELEDKLGVERCAREEKAKFLAAVEKRLKKLEGAQKSKRKARKAGM